MSLGMLGFGRWVVMGQEISSIWLILMVGNELVHPKWVSGVWWGMDGMDVWFCLLAHHGSFFPLNRTCKHLDELNL